MAGFVGRSTATMHCALPVQGAMVAWLDPERQMRCMPASDQMEMIDGALRVVLPEERHAMVRFTGEYVLRWTIDGGTIRCETIGGNMDVTSTARFTAAPGGCTIVYADRVELDLGLNALLTRAVRPLAQRLMSRGQAEFSRRMQAELDKLG
jgi:carbon monoxide dehydrogenase subunit G